MSDNQVVVIEQMPANEVANSGADMAQIIYILYLVGYAVPATALAGMFLATINRKTAAPWVASHMTFQLRTFWIGLFPGLTTDHIAYMVETIASFINK